MAARLPGPAWVVMQTEMLFDMEVLRSLKEDVSMPIKDLVPKGSFATQSEANARVRQVADELVASIRGARIVDRSNLTPGVLALAIMNDRSGDKPVGFSLMASRQ